MYAHFFTKILTFLLCLCLVGANAQDHSMSDSTYLEYLLNDVVVTAQYAPTALQNAVHNVKVIKAEQIQQEGQNNLAEVLANQLNLRVNADPLLGNGLAIQGISGENVQVLIDGVPVIGRLNGNIDLSQINLHNVQQIEIIEGAMSAQYGSNAAGGVVNIITKKSQVNPFNVQTQSQYESIGILNNAVSLGTQVGKWYLRVSGNYNENQFAHEDSLRLYHEVETILGEPIKTKVNPWNPKTQLGMDGTLRYRWNDSTSISYQYRWFEEELSSYGEIRRPQFRPYAFDEFYTTNREDHSLLFDTYIGNHFYLQSTTGYNQFDRLKAVKRLDIEADTTSTIEAEQDTATFKTFLHRSILSTTRPSGWNAQVGLEVMSETGLGKRIVDTTSLPINQSRIDNYAVWVGAKYQRDNWTLKTNLRYGYNTQYDHPLIPSIHLKWAPIPKWQVQASYAHGFRAPTLKELYFNFIDINHYIVGNTDLRAEHSKNSMLEVRYAPFTNATHDLTLKGKLFYNDIQNRIVIAEFAPFQFNYQNLDAFETHGVNFQTFYNWKEQLQLQAGLSYTRLLNHWAADYDTEQFIGLFEMQNRLAWEVPMVKTKLVLTHRYIGRQVQFYQDAEENLQQGFLNDYHLFNATLSRTFWNKHIFVALGAKNLFDVQAVPIVAQSDTGHSSSNQLLNWGRTYFVRLNLEF